MRKKCEKNEEIPAAELQEFAMKFVFGDFALKAAAHKPISCRDKLRRGLGLTHPKAYNKHTSRQFFVGRRKIGIY